MPQAQWQTTRLLQLAVFHRRRSASPAPKRPATLRLRARTQELVQMRAAIPEPATIMLFPIICQWLANSFRLVAFHSTNSSTCNSRIWCHEWHQCSSTMTLTTRRRQVWELLECEEMRLLPIWDRWLTQRWLMEDLRELITMRALWAMCPALSASRRDPEGQWLICPLILRSTITQTWCLAAINKHTLVCRTFIL